MPSTSTDVQDFLHYMTSVRGSSPRTVAIYADALERLEEHFLSLDANLTWRTLPADAIRSWQATEMERGLKARTVCTMLSGVRTFFRYMLWAGRIESDPARLLRNPKREKRLPVVLRESELDHLFDDIAFPDTYEGHRDRLILLMFYHTGVRLSELTGLDVCQVALATREVKVRGKRNKERIIPYGDELARALATYLPLREKTWHAADGPLFLSNRGGRMTNGAVQRVVHDRLSLVSDARQRSPHVLRHTYATTLLTHGASLEAIKELLGHESVATTEIYTHTTFADLRREYEKAFK